MKILLLDDSAAIHKVVQLGLGTGSGVDLGICSDPTSVKNEVLKRQPDLIIASESVAGQPTASLIPKAFPWKDKIILLADTSDSEQKLRQAGFDRVLRKPFRLPEFRQLVSDFKLSSQEKVLKNKPIERPDSQESVSRRFVEEVLAGQKTEARPHSNENSKPLVSSNEKQLNTSSNESKIKESQLPLGSQGHGSEMAFPALTIDLSSLETVLKNSRDSGGARPDVHQEQKDLLERARKLRLNPSEVWGAQDATPKSPSQMTGSKLGFESEARSNTQMHTPKGADGQNLENSDHQVQLPPWFTLDETKPGSTKKDPRPSLSTASEKVEKPSNEAVKTVGEDITSEQIGEMLDDRISDLERRLESSLRLEIDRYLLEATESIVTSKVESFLNSRWPNLLKSITQQVKRSVESEYTSRMHTDLISMQKNLGVELRAELRSEVQSALRNWMGQYSRDILKEVAREELQKILDES